MSEISPIFSNMNISNQKNTNGDKTVENVQEIVDNSDVSDDSDDSDVSDGEFVELFKEKRQFGILENKIVKNVELEYPLVPDDDVNVQKYNATIYRKNHPDEYEYILNKCKDVMYKLKSKDKSTRIVSTTLEKNKRML